MAWSLGDVWEGAMSVDTTLFWVVDWGGGGSELRRLLGVVVEEPTYAKNPRSDCH